jgi:heme-degrading monooxygenase HmoA
MNPQEYYAVIFTSKRTQEGAEDYKTMASQMESLAATQPGFIGIESVRGEDGVGITVSYWKTIEDIKNWKTNTDHLLAQKKGRSEFYSSYKVRICKVEREYEFKF